MNSMLHGPLFIIHLDPLSCRSDVTEPSGKRQKKHVWIASRQEVIKHPLVGGIVYYNHKTTLSLTSHSGESKSFITFHQMSTGTQFFFVFVFLLFIFGR